VLPGVLRVLRPLAPRAPSTTGQSGAFPTAIAPNGVDRLTSLQRQLLDPPMDALEHPRTNDALASCHTRSAAGLQPR